MRSCACLLPMRALLLRFDGVCRDCESAARAQVGSPDFGGMVDMMGAISTELNAMGTGPNDEP